MRDRVRGLLGWAWRRKFLLAGLGVLGLIGMLFAMHQTSGPLFCGSCHEMGYEYRTWRASSHGDVTCDHCHYHPGVIGMIRTKWQGAGEAISHLRRDWTESEIGPGMAEVPSERCLKCHDRAKLPAEIDYHLLHHTHAKHLERGAQCTDCHANVVHGGKAPFKNTPTMSSCLRCHDGKQAPNDCSLCHQQLGEIRPALYNPAWVTHHKENIAATGEERCRKCHGESFCRSCHAVARPSSHTANWIHDHAAMDSRDVGQCAKCHPTRGARPMADFCVECHEARSAHGPEYIREHPQQFQRDPDACGRCHEESFCRNCHAIYRPHQPGWLTAHGRQAQTRRDSCRTCHKDAFCTACHTKGRPASHTDDWPKTHPAAVRGGAEGCRVCHPTNFCQGCHRKALPASHRESRWIRAHGGTALGARDSCRACHDASYCASCHRGVSMPHPDNWLHAHPRSGVREKACQACHPTAFCKACHEGARPSDHTKQWSRTHGKVAEASRARCMKCHNEDYCQVCHRVRMPHPRDIKTNHGALARGADGRYCGLCHATEVCAACHSRRNSMPTSHRSDQWRRTHGQSQDLDSRCALCHQQTFCQDCHGLAMPHPDNWLLSAHSWAARSDPDACAKCHDTDYCRTCHESTPPSTHEAADYRQTHGKGANEPLCALCHGRATAKQQDACLTCHRGVKMPHEARFAFKHKDVASFDPQGTCLGCHGVEYCKVCHAVVPRRGQ